MICILRFGIFFFYFVLCELLLYCSFVFLKNVYVFAVKLSFQYSWQFVSLCFFKIIQTCNKHTTYCLTNLWLEHIYLLSLYRTRKLTAGIPNGKSNDKTINLTVVLLYNSLLLKFQNDFLVIAI